jgi:hypothetical protein
MLSGGEHSDELARGRGEGQKESTREAMRRPAPSYRYTRHLHGAETDWFQKLVVKE